jgi:hypothetical protein
VCLERGPLSLVSTIEELLGRRSSGSGLESREFCRGDSLRWPRDTPYPQKLAQTSPTVSDRVCHFIKKIWCRNISRYFSEATDLHYVTLEAKLVIVW